jgi:hypothetical protein
MRAMRVPLALALVLAAAGAAESQTIVVDSATCRALVAHAPAADVAYRGGVDVHGRRVAGADLEPSAPPALAREFTFDLQVDLAGRVPAHSRLFQPALTVGRVSMTPDGRFAFNGQPLDDPERVAIAELCARRAR